MHKQNNLKQAKAAAVTVVLCDCGRELRRRVDFKRLAARLAALEKVAAVRECSELCSEKECLAVLGQIGRRKAPRIVVAACLEENLEAVLRAGMRKKGLNPGFMWLAGIRACGGKNKAAAADAAFARIEAAVNRVSLATPIESSMLRTNRDALVVGAGPAGIEAAIAIAGLGHKVALAFKAEKPGGAAGETPEFCGHLGADSGESAAAVAGSINALVREAETNPRITLHPASVLQSLSGELGGFTATLVSRFGREHIQCGAVVLASGSVKESASGNSRHGQRIVDMAGLADIMRGGIVPLRVAVVMDACCEQEQDVSMRVLSAVELLARDFKCRVKVFCNNVRTAAMGMEALYRRAREAGVVFVKPEKTVRPIEDAAAVRVDFIDPAIGAPVSEEFDLAVMADMRPARDPAGTPGGAAGVKCDGDGAAQYDNVWLPPALTSRPGILAAGAARGANGYCEAMQDGLAAARQVHELLGPGRIEILDDAATVDPEKCVLCLTCMRICPSGAISINQADRAASVSKVACRRCGICAAECPAQAITLPRYTDGQIAAEVSARPGITVFACENSALPAAAAVEREYGATVDLVRVPCAGKVDPRSVLAALESGAEKVVILGCHPQSCQYLSGAGRAERRMARLAGMLEKAGFAGSRVVFKGIAAMESARFLEVVGDARSQAHT